MNNMYRIISVWKYTIRFKPLFASISSLISIYLFICICIFACTAIKVYLFKCICIYICVGYCKIAKPYGESYGTVERQTFNGVKRSETVSTGHR